jgi:hypothetical protein
MKHPVAAVLLYADRQTERDRRTYRYDEANSRFSQFRERAPQKKRVLEHRMRKFFWNENKFALPYYIIF